MDGGLFAIIIKSVMNDIMKKKILLTSLLILVLIYFNTPYHIEKYRWKHLDGGRISDMIVLGEKRNYKLCWPCIYRMNDEKVGYVLFCIYDHMWIYSYRDGQDYGIGIYIMK